MSEDSSWFEEKFGIVFRRLGGAVHGTKEIGVFRIEHEDGIGTWVYKRGHGLIYANTYNYPIYVETEEVFAAMSTFRRYLILEELAGI